jgi:predicted nucleic acid-binding protein
MKVIIDTSVWSLALRRSDMGDDPYVIACRRLVVDDRVVMLGPIRQELLSGIRHQAQFDKLRVSLEAFPDFPIRTEDWEMAAACFNTCRRQGVQGSNTDFLLCAVAMRAHYGILSNDNDFINFSNVLPITLCSPGEIGLTQ